jgi:PAS domain S-box-containing protein
MHKGKTTLIPLDPAGSGQSTRLGQPVESPVAAGPSSGARPILHGVLIFQDGELVLANPVAVQMLDVEPEAIYSLTVESFLALVRPEDRPRLEQSWHNLLAGEIVPLQPEVCLLRQDGALFWVDVLLNGIEYQGEPALQVNFLDISQRRQVEESLRQHIQRLQILHDIEHAVLSALDERLSARAALRQIHTVVPSYRASSVVLVDLSSREARLLALDFNRRMTDWEIRKAYALEELSIDLDQLSAGRSYQVDDLSELPRLTSLQRDMLELGIRSYLSVPLRLGGELIGTLNLASEKPYVFKPDHARIAQEVADSLAVAIQQARLREAEQQRRQEAEIMRDVMAALASAATMNQTLEIILVNLRNVVEYDRAGLFLLDETNRYVLMEKSGSSSDDAYAIHPTTDPLVEEFRRTRRPVFIHDIQTDQRFGSWTDMQSIHGWMGAPLLAGQDVIGFLSLGSLEPGAYSGTDAAMIQAFTSQVADVLERARLHDQSHRRTEELEVLSSITVALGQADTSENTLSATMDLVTRFFGAVQGVFLFPDKTKTQLVGKLNLDGNVLVLSHPVGDDLLWQVYNSGQSAAISDVKSFLQGNVPEIYRLLYNGMQSAVLIPLKSENAIFGVLCFTFRDWRSFSAEDLKLYNAIAEVAGSSLRRAVVLEGLEKQVNVRTQHLSTLYHINAIASERLDLFSILEQVLKILLESMNNACGAIHLLNPSGRELHLYAQHNLPPEMAAKFDVLELQDSFWRSLVDATTPLVVPDMRNDERLPAWFLQGNADFARAYIGTPVRSKGQLLGLLSIFNSAPQDYTIDDITLLMTIADQVGIFVERARLIRQAEQAAVVEERQRLARELHDSVTQLLYSQVLFAGAGLKVLNQGNLPLIRQHLSRIDQGALQALREMRLLVYELRPSDYLEEGLQGALQRRLDAVENRTGMNARLTVTGELNLDESTEMALYRIAQEALNNTLKHAGATAVSVEVRSSPGRVELEIADNGCGFNLQDKHLGGGMGLATMQERINALKGSLRILTRPGAGTRVIAILEESK